MADPGFSSEGFVFFLQAQNQPNLAPSLQQLLQKNLSVASEGGWGSFTPNEPPGSAPERVLLGRNCVQSFYVKTFKKPRTFLKPRFFQSRLGVIWEQFTLPVFRRTVCPCSSFDCQGPVARQFSPRVWKNPSVFWARAPAATPLLWNIPKVVYHADCTIAVLSMMVTHSIHDKVVLVIRTGSWCRLFLPLFDILSYSLYSCVAFLMCNCGSRQVNWHCKGEFHFFKKMSESRRYTVEMYASAIIG